MAENKLFEDLDLPDEDVTIDADDLLDENGELNLDAVAPQKPIGNSKVDLDLDDAPFLRDESSEDEVKTTDGAEDVMPLTLQHQETVSEPAGLQRVLKNKKVMIGSGGLVLLLVLLLLIFSGNDSVSPPPAEERPLQPETELPPIEAKPGEVLIEWEPFWVEYKDESSGEIRFLVCELSAPTTEPSLKAEAEAKLLTIRDAIYYYLSHKPLVFLSNQQNAETMKEDLVGIVNGYLTQGQLSQIYIENYLIK